MSFRNRTQPGHHQSDSILEELPIDMVKSFPVSDALHLFDLGIMKRYYDVPPNYVISLHSKIRIVFLHTEVYIL